MSRNTGAGVFIGAFSMALGFAMIWHIWWLALAGLLGVIAVLIVRTSGDDTGVRRARRGNSPPRVERAPAGDGAGRSMSDRVMDDNTPRDGASGQHNTASIRLFGFWVYLMSDCILFASLFVTFAVLHASYAGGPTGKDIFALPGSAARNALSSHEQPDLRAGHPGREKGRTC